VVRNGPAIEPPSYLGDEGRAFFAKVVSEYEIDATHGELVVRAAECCDRLAAGRRLRSSLPGILAPSIGAFLLPGVLGAARPSEHNPVLGHIG
jgi:hypothetical protein